MASPYPNKDKPPVLKRPRSFKRFVLILLALGVLIYLGVAATAFLRNQTQPDATPHATSRERALNEQAN